MLMPKQPQTASLSASTSFSGLYPAAAVTQSRLQVAAVTNAAALAVHLQARTCQ
jgi:hypothetical protein